MYEGNGNFPENCLSEEPVSVEQVDQHVPLEIRTRCPGPARPQAAWRSHRLCGVAFAILNHSPRRESQAGPALLIRNLLCSRKPALYPDPQSVWCRTFLQPGTGWTTLPAPEWSRPGMVRRRRTSMSDEVTWRSTERLISAAKPR